MLAQFTSNQWLLRDGESFLQGKIPTEVVQSQVFSSGHKYIQAMLNRLSRLCMHDVFIYICICIYVTIITKEDIIIWGRLWK